MPAQVGTLSSSKVERNDATLVKCHSYSPARALPPFLLRFWPIAMQPTKLAEIFASCTTPAPMQQPSMVVRPGAEDFLCLKQHPRRIMGMFYNGRAQAAARH